MRSDISPRHWPWSVFKDLFKVLGFGLVIKSLALGWPCQFVLEIVHQADSEATVSCQCLSGNVCLSLLFKVLI